MGQRTGRYQSTETITFIQKDIPTNKDHITREKGFTYKLAATQHDKEHGTNSSRESLKLQLAVATFELDNNNRQ